MIKMIAAVSKNNQIGKNGNMPWYIPEDLQYFKEITLGHTTLMGRKTYESIGHPLPDRRNIILTRDPSFTAEGIEVIHSLEEALNLYSQIGELFIIGGSQIYTLFLPYASMLYLTLLDQDVIGDTAFPNYQQDFHCISQSAIQFSQPSKVGFTFTIWKRISPLK